MFIQDYMALSPEDKQIVNDKLIDDEKTPADWIETFKVLAEVDSQGDKVRNISYWAGISGIVLSVIGVIGFFAESTPLLLLLIPGLLLIVVGFAIYYKMVSLDLPGEVIKETLVPILGVLREEVKSNGKVTLKVDLRGFKHSDKYQREEDIAHYKNTITRYFYLDPWFEGKTVLADGTKLVWNVEDYVSHKVKKKYGSSGKYKGKEIKNKIKSVMTVQAGMNKKRLVVPPRLKQKGDEGKIFTQKHNGEQWMTIKRAFKHGEYGKFSPKNFVDTIASVYMRAKPRGGNS